MPDYHFIISGTAADGQTWKTSGVLQSTGHMATRWPELVDDALGESFRALTDGKAVYGKPGVGCKGPYSVNELHIEKIAE